MGTTANFALRYPESSAAPEVWTDMHELADDVDTALQSHQVILNAAPRGILKRHRRFSAASLTGGTERGLILLPVNSLVVNKLLKITGMRLRFSSTVTTDHVKYNLRYSSTGAATITSTILGRAEADHLETVDLQTLYTPPGAENGSFLLTAIRTTGTGAVTIQADEGGFDLVVEEMGSDPGAAGGTTVAP